MNKILVALGVILTIAASAEGVSLNFISSPTITVYQTGVFHCYVDTEGVTIQWQVNGTLSTSEKMTSLGIVTTGLGTGNSSLSIPGVATIDGTIVTCIASGLVNGKQYFNSSSATLYIQGKPSAVDMTCTSNGYQLQCNWTAPYTYIDITQYTVDVTFVTQCGEQIIHTLCSSIDTQLTYNVTGPGTYSVSVVAMIGDDLAGVASITEVTINQFNEGDLLVTSSVHHMTSSTGPWHTSYEVLSSSSIVESQSMNEYYNYLDSLSNDCECMGANALLEYNEKIYIGVIIALCLICLLLFLLTLMLILIVWKQKQIIDCQKQDKVYTLDPATIGVADNPCYETVTPTSRLHNL